MSIHPHPQWHELITMTAEFQTMRDSGASNIALGEKVSEIGYATIALLGNVAAQTALEHRAHVTTLVD